MASYEEADAIKRILRHHGHLDSPLAGDLETFIDWIIAGERAKTSLVRGTKPMPLLSLLGSMGIYGAEVLNTVRAGGDDDAGREAAL